MRHTGLDIIGDVPWGTHFCQFYQDENDLVDLLAPYFKAGLANNELCMWITSEPLGVEDAKQALRRDGVDVERYIAGQQLKVLDYRDWYTKGGTFEAESVLRAWVDELEAGRRRGLDGLRLTGNTFWLEQSLWKDFTEYEAAVDGVIGRYPMLAMCTYCLGKCGAAEIMDVMSNHAFALIKRGGSWQAIESAERRKIKASLNSTEARYQSLFNGMTEGFALHEIICDDDGRPCDYRFLDINPAFERLTGLRREVVVGRLMSEVLPNEDRRWVERYGQVALTGVPAHFDNFAPTLDRHYEVYAYRPGQGQFAVIFMDISDLKRTQARLAEANRMKDEFLANLSHELRTPLNAILGWADLLSKKQLDPATTQRALETIARNAKAQAQLVSDVLDLSRIVAGKMRLNVQQVDLGGVVENSLDALRPAAAAKGISLSCDVAAPNAKVTGDPDRLQQILWNLVSNAVKFTPAGGRVAVRLGRADSRLELTVSDTGVGIDPAFLPFVFDRFSQSDTSTARQHGGLGLGLAIVRHLVELHGGTVSAASAGEGQGARFSVVLPVRAVMDSRWRGTEVGKPPEQPAVAEGLTLPVRALGGVSVVAVDDEADARELVRAVLEQHGASVRVAGSVDEALALLAQEPPHLLVADIGMPGRDGYDLIREVREGGDLRLTRIPAIALTAYGREEDRLRVVRAGFQQHVAKPVLPDDLVAVIIAVRGVAASSSS